MLENLYLLLILAKITQLSKAFKQTLKKTEYVFIKLPFMKKKKGDLFPSGSPNKAFTIV